MTETEITHRALTARSRLSPEERRKLEREAEQFAARHARRET